NPLYNWDVMKGDGFGWWIRRIEGASRLFDAIRIDHFRGLESYWAVPAASKTAKTGEWVKGPGMDLLRVLTGWFPNITYIAEDLGILTDAVHELRDGAGLPGMKVLEFAFSDASNSYLPHNYTNPNCICYTGTHDNDTLMGWCKSVKKAEKAYAEAYLGAKGAKDMRDAVLRAGQGSVAVLFVAQMQDYLGLGTEARTNVPGVADGNWRWRMASGAATAKVAEEIRALTETYGRCAPRPKKEDKKAAKKAAKADK
ncbi:MAG: 4-alpha-glucanotransferase, partial [Oscillospiraceae bacterium]|nr:4-alpha-glucanotransferase [Oscillospiraceae bacterium]